MADDTKSQLSKMSGASNFDMVDQYTKKADRKDGDETSSKYRNQKLTSLQSKRQDNDLGFLNEEEQWATIYKFNKQLFDKESDILKRREQERKLKVKEELDQQVSEKQGRKIQQRAEEEAFYKNQLLQCEMFDRREQERAEAARHLKMIEKHGRDQQIKENKKQRRVETKQEKALDSYMIQKVKEELDEETKFNHFKKDHQYQAMQKLLVENEERKKRQLLQQEQERAENVKLMDAYCRLLDQQEMERTKAIKERDEKIKQYQARALEMQEQELEKKLGVMEKRATKYEIRKEKRIQDQERQAELRKKQQKADIKDFLFKQINEKDTRKNEEKLKDYEQATVWDQENKKYFEWEQSRKDQRQAKYKEYQQILKDQMTKK